MKSDPQPESVVRNAHGEELLLGKVLPVLLGEMGR